MKINQHKIMIIDEQTDIVKPWLERHLQNSEKPVWGDPDRVFTLRLGQPETSPGGIFYLRLNKIAIDSGVTDSISKSRGVTGIVRAFKIDPKVDTPTVIIEILPHKKGTELNVKCIEPVLTEYVNQLLLEIAERFSKKKRGLYGPKPDSPEKIRRFHELRKKGIPQTDALKKVKNEFRTGLDIRTYQQHCLKITDEYPYSAKD